MKWHGERVGEINRGCVRCAAGRVGVAERVGELTGEARGAACRPGRWGESARGTLALQLSS